MQPVLTKIKMALSYKLNLRILTACLFLICAVPNFFIFIHESLNFRIFSDFALLGTMVGIWYYGNLFLVPAFSLLVAYSWITSRSGREKMMCFMSFFVVYGSYLILFLAGLLPE